MMFRAKLFNKRGRDSRIAHGRVFMSLFYCVACIIHVVTPWWFVTVGGSIVLATPTSYRNSRPRKWASTSVTHKSHTHSYNQGVSLEVEKEGVGSTHVFPGHLHSILWLYSHNATHKETSLKILLSLFALNRGFISLNSVNQLIFVMVKCGVLFEVRTGFLNII
jgi:hypothetical protein